MSEIDNILKTYTENLARPNIMKVTDRVTGIEFPIASVPNGEGGWHISSVKNLAAEYHPRPERRTGYAIHKDINSFNEWVNRFKDEETTIFAEIDPTGATLTGQTLRAIIDYHEHGPENIDSPKDSRARHCQFGAVYPFPWSLELQAWHKISGKAMTQVELAEFIERHIDDVILPPVKVKNGELDRTTGDDAIDRVITRPDMTLATPADLLALAKGISVFSEAKAEQRYNHSTGEVSLGFSTQHKSENFKVPNFMLLSMPVFVGMAQPVLMGCHIRYRVREEKVTWSLELHRVDRVIKHAVNETLALVDAETGVHIYIGHPKA